MIESPLVKQIVDEARQQAILQVLESRFGAVPPEIAERIRAESDEARLGELTRAAARSATLDEFAANLD